MPLYLAVLRRHVISHQFIFVTICMLTATCYASCFGKEDGVLQEPDLLEWENHVSRIDMELVFYDISSWQRATEIGLSGMARAYAVASRIVMVRVHPRSLARFHTVPRCLPASSDTARVCHTRRVVRAALPWRLRELWRQDRKGMGVMRYWRTQLEVPGVWPGEILA